MCVYATITDSDVPDIIHRNSPDLRLNCLQGNQQTTIGKKFLLGDLAEMNLMPKKHGHQGVWLIATKEALTNNVPHIFFAADGNFKFCCFFKNNK